VNSKLYGCPFNPAIGLVLVLKDCPVRLSFACYSGNTFPPLFHYRHMSPPKISRVIIEKFKNFITPFIEPPIDSRYILTILGTIYQRKAAQFHLIVTEKSGADVICHKSPGSFYRYSRSINLNTTYYTYTHITYGFLELSLRL
jgi:hypothetical protein